MTGSVEIGPVREYLLALQEKICGALVAEDGGADFVRDELPGERGGGARPWVLSGGRVFERAAVSFSHTAGALELRLAARAGLTRGAPHYRLPGGSRLAGRRGVGELEALPRGDRSSISDPKGTSASG